LVVAPLSDGTTTSETEASDDGSDSAVASDDLREGIVADLRGRLGDALIDSHISPDDDVWVRVRTEAWLDTAKCLAAAGFTYFSFLSAIDWMPSPYGKGEDDPTAEPVEPDTEIRSGVAGGDTRLQVFARLTDLARHVGVTVKVDVDDDQPVLDSWVEVFAGANWHERECHEMFGVGFNHHPDLRNIYLPTEFEGNPLRKDFPLVARMVKPWPGIVDVEPMPDPEDDPSSRDESAADAEPGVVSASGSEAAAEGSASDEADAARGESAADAEPAIENGES
jgi:NADH-quinone oxidoreductase subunit C